MGNTGLGLYLYEDSKDDSFHRMNSETQLPGIPAGTFWIETVSDGLVNREWDSVVPGAVYCAELISRNIDTATEVMLVEVFEDGRTLTIEVITGTQCPDGPYSFSTDAHTMYRLTALRQFEMSRVTISPSPRLSYLGFPRSNCFHQTFEPLDASISKSAF